MPNVPKISRPTMPTITMPQVRMPTITTPNMPQMPSMPRLAELRTPGKFLPTGRPRMPKIDISRSIDSIKNYIPLSYATRRPAEPEVIPEEPEGDGQSLEAPRASSAASVNSADSKTSFFTTYFTSIWSSIQVLVFIGYESLIDGFKNYICKSDAMIVILYALIGILLRNYFYCQEIHQWSTKHSPLNSNAENGSSATTAALDGHLAAVNPLSVLPKLTSGRFAIIVLVTLNKLNRYQRDLITSPKTEPTTTLQKIWKRVKRVNIIAFDAVRCLLKDFVLSTIINGPKYETLYDDLKFVAITSFIINHTVKAPSWYKRQSIIWSIMQIEYQVQLASSILLILNEG